MSIRNRFKFKAPTMTTFFEVVLKKNKLILIWNFYSYTDENDIVIVSKNRDLGFENNFKHLRHTVIFFYFSPYFEIAIR